MDIHTTCFHSVKNISLVHFYTFGLNFYITKGQKGIFDCVCYIFWVLQRVYKTRKFLVCPETFGLKLLVSFLVSFRYPFWKILDFLVSFRYPFWRILDFLVSFRYPETYFRLFPTRNPLHTVYTYFFFFYYWGWVG